MMIAMFTLLLVVSGVNTEQDQLMERKEEERGGERRREEEYLGHSLARSVISGQERAEPWPAGAGSAENGELSGPGRTRRTTLALQMIILRYCVVICKEFPCLVSRYTFYDRAVFVLSVESSQFSVAPRCLNFSRPGPLAAAASQG